MILDSFKLFLIGWGVKNINFGPFFSLASVKHKAIRLHLDQKKELVFDLKCRLLAVVRASEQSIFSPLPSINCTQQQRIIDIYDFYIEALTADR